MRRDSHEPRQELLCDGDHENDPNDAMRKRRLRAHKEHHDERSQSQNGSTNLDTQQREGEGEREN